jgi:hypothetical protein
LVIVVLLSAAAAVVVGGIGIGGVGVAAPANLTTSVCSADDLTPLLIADVLFFTSTSVVVVVAFCNDVNFDMSTAKMWIVF